MPARPPHAVAGARSRAVEKTLINLVDDTDSANGFAGVLPRNAITLFVTAPEGFSDLDDHDDWLYTLVSHEYTHVLHLDTMSGLPSHLQPHLRQDLGAEPGHAALGDRGLRRLRGVEALGGRPQPRLALRPVSSARRAAGKDLRLDEVTGAPRRFPRGNAAYVYGSHFLRYVFDRFGDDTARQDGHAAGDYPVPFSVNRQIAKVTGAPFTALYDDWKAYLRDRYGMQEMAAERRGLAAGRRLTDTAEANFYPRYTADGEARLAPVRRLPASRGCARCRWAAIRAPRATSGATSRATSCSSTRWGRSICSPGRLCSCSSRAGGCSAASTRTQDLFRWDARTGQIGAPHPRRPRARAVAVAGRPAASRSR